MPSSPPPPLELALPPWPPDMSLSLMTVPWLPSMMSPPECCDVSLTVVSLPSPTMIGEWLPLSMTPVLALLPWPTTLPSPWVVWVWMSPEEPVFTTPPLVAVLLVLSPSVMSPKPRLNAPFWAFAPAD
jgi:hypothetical protein